MKNPFTPRSATTNPWLRCGMKFQDEDGQWCTCTRKMRHPMRGPETGHEANPDLAELLDRA